MQAEAEAHHQTGEQQRRLRQRLGARLTPPPTGVSVHGLRGRSVGDDDQGGGSGVIGRKRRRSGERCTEDKNNRLYIYFRRARARPAHTAVTRHTARSVSIWHIHVTDG